MAYIGEQLDAFARDRPDETAITCGSARVSWFTLVQKIKAAENLISRLAPRSGRVALMLDDPLALVVCFFACARSCRVAMVMDPKWPSSQTDIAIAETEPDLLIDDMVYARLSQDVSPSNASGFSAAHEKPEEESPFYVGFTSGSTGVPKGYLRSHGSWLHSFALSDREFETPAKARIILAGQLVHSLHLYGAIFGIASGREIVLRHQFDPRRLLREISQSENGACLYATPTHVHYLVEAADRSIGLETLKQVLVSGAKWHDQEKQAFSKVFPSASLYEFYGASEASFITVAKGRGLVPAGSVGRIATGVDVAIGDPAAHTAPGVTGLIWVRSNMLFSGYVCGSSDETRWKDGWLSFGDNGCLDDQGFLFLTGRANRMVITSGLNVYPEEIEALLARHPSVELAVVTGISDPVRGQVLEAIVKLSSALPDAEFELQRHCRMHLEPGKIPRRFHITDQLALTAGGKPDIQKATAHLQR